MSKFDTNTTSYCISCDYYHAFGFCPLCDKDKLIKKEDIIMSKESEKYLQAILEKFCDHLNPIYYQEFSYMIFKYGEKCAEEALQKVAIPKPSAESFCPPPRPMSTIDVNLPKEKKIVRYMIVSNDDDSLEVKVKEHLETGWQPFGGVAVTFNKDEQQWGQWQVMVKYDQ